MGQELTAIITAAGASRRMGTHKALLSWRGRPLVAYQVETLREAGFEAIAVVTGAEADAVAAATPDEATLVHNADWPTGRSGSIETAAEALPDDPHAVLVVAVDQPLSACVLDDLILHAGEPLVQPVDDDGRHGHPVILGGGHLEALRDLEREPAGLRSLVRRLRPEGRLVTVGGSPDWDLNEPEDYRRARDRAAGE